MGKNLEVEIDYFLEKLKNNFRIETYDRCLDLIVDYEGDKKQDYLKSLNDILKERRENINAHK